MRQRANRPATVAIVLLAGLVGAWRPAGPVGAQEVPVEALLSRVQANYRAPSRISARFEQRTETRPGMPVRVSTGVLQMRAPGRLRMAYAETGNTLVADGERLYWYLPADRQVQIRSQDALSQRGTALLYLSGQGDLLDDFTVAGTEWRTKLAPGNVQLRLDPRVGDTDYSYLLLEVDPDVAIIARLVSFGLFGETTDFRFTDVELDADLADGQFRFTIPPGVEVETLGN